MGCNLLPGIAIRKKKTDEQGDLGTGMMSKNRTQKCIANYIRSVETQRLYRQT